MDSPCPRDVLVVEDDPDIRESLFELLELEGYRVHTACNGAEALAVLGHAPIMALVLLDLMMPVTDGYEFLDRLRRAQISDVRVLVLSATLDASRVRMSPSVVGVLAKPVDVPRVLSMVHRWTEGQRPVGRPN